MISCVDVLQATEILHPSHWNSHQVFCLRLVEEEQLWTICALKSGKSNQWDSKTNPIADWWAAWWCWKCCDVICYSCWVISDSWCYRVIAVIGPDETKACRTRTSESLQLKPGCISELLSDDQKCCFEVQSWTRQRFPPQGSMSVCFLD